MDLRETNEYKRTVVNISSAEILTMGLTPIELLPAPGAGKYYDFEKLVSEFTPGVTPYGTSLELTFYNGSFPNMEGQLHKSFPSVNIAYAGSTYIKTLTEAVCSPPNKLNQPLLLTTADGSNPTDGDGTMRMIITYAIRTFGA